MSELRAFNVTGIKQDMSETTRTVLAKDATEAVRDMIPTFHHVTLVEPVKDTEETTTTKFSQDITSRSFEGVRDLPNPPEESNRALGSLAGHSKGLILPLLTMMASSP